MTMKIDFIHIFMFLLLVGSHVSTEKLALGQNGALSNHTATAYSVGVHMGIINPEVYSLESFERDERNVINDAYKKYISLTGDHPISYQEWLIMNNYGIMSDTQESLLQRPKSIRSSNYNHKVFMDSVRKGDILITGNTSFGGLIGHAAMMVSDNSVMEMPGGKAWMVGIKSNNRIITKNQWFDSYGSTKVYRCPNSSVAHKAADWAIRNYYNTHGGKNKTIHVTYLITLDIRSLNPSYCSKLVVQAYYFGTGSRKVIKDVFEYGTIIIPIIIPFYFMSPYKLEKVVDF